MIEYIEANKEWLFSGAGIVLLTVLFTVAVKFKNYFDLKNSERKRSSSSNKALKITHLDFDAIKNAIDTAIPIQRDGVIKSFKGLGIRWGVHLLRATTDGDIVRLVLTTRLPNRQNTIYCDVRAEDYPELNALKEGDKLVVTGAIKEASVWDIWLDNVSISFNDAAATPNKSLITDALTRAR